MCHNDHRKDLHQIGNGQHMNYGNFLPHRYLTAFAFLIFLGTSAFAQEKPALIRDLPAESTGTINLDRDLEEPVPVDRAKSYYHYALAKFFENRDDLETALSEMRLALKHNNENATVHLEMASLLQKSGQIGKAMEYAQEAAALDPQDPDPHWFIANIYSTPQGGRGGVSIENLKKAVQELETLKELTPEDERVHYFLGRAYFDLNEPEKAIESYEKFQTLAPNTDHGYREIAKYYNSRGELEKAAEYLLKSLDIAPDSSEILGTLGAIYSKLGKYKEAISVFKKLMETTSHKMAVGHDLADLLFRTGEYSETIDVLNDLIEAEPRNRTARILLGRAQVGLRRFPEAIETFQAIVKMNPGDLEALFYLGTAYEQAGKYGDASNIFSELLKTANTNSDEALANRPVFQQHLAASYMEMGEYEKAIAVYQEMIDSDVEEPQGSLVIKQQLAFAYMEAGEFQKAIDIYQEMSEAEPRLDTQLLNAYRISRQFELALPFGKELYDKDPDSIPVGLYYAQTLADAGKIEEGAEVLSELLKSNPQEIDLHIALSQVYLQGKRYTEAEAILRQAEKNELNDTQSEMLKFNLAALFERKKNYDQAEHLFRDILKTNPQNASALNYIGYMLADRGIRLEEALEYVQKALAIDPNNGAYLDSLGWAFFKLNDMENAEKYLLEAGKMVRNDPIIDEHLGDLYFETGDLQKAQHFWMKSLSITTDPEDIQKVRQKLDKLQQTLQKHKSEK
jgi:pentatricopeptide repeat protein